MDFLPPVRCYTCGKPLGDLMMRCISKDDMGNDDKEWKKMFTPSKTSPDTMHSMGITRMCCKRHVLGWAGMCITDSFSIEKTPTNTSSCK